MAYASSLGTVFWTFPNDRCLGDAAALRADLPVIRAACPGAAVTIDVVGYNPERAVIARLSDGAGTPRGYAKLYAAGTMAPAGGILAWLRATIDATRTPLRVPSVLGEDHDREILVVGAVAGRHLEAVADGELEGAFGRLGAALAHLHGLPLPADALALPRWTGVDDAALGHAADTLAWARPDLAGLVHDTAARLSRCRPAMAGAVGLHGDMNSRNWLITRHDVGLIDFDQAAAGPAAGDLAAVLAWLRSRTLTGAWPAAREAALAGALLGGYAAVRALPGDAELAWHRAAALVVERAMRAVTRVRPETLGCLHRLIVDAHRQSGEVAHG